MLKKLFSCDFLANFRVYFPIDSFIKSQGANKKLSFVSLFVWKTEDLFSRFTLLMNGYIIFKIIVTGIHFYTSVVLGKVFFYLNR